MQGATNVEWEFYTPATHVAKLTRTSIQLTATSPNVKDALLGRSITQFVGSAVRLSGTREGSRSTNDSFTLLNEMKNEQKLQQNTPVEVRTKGTAKYGPKLSWIQ
jgi:PBP1b-binding outer membrane lipoprotein LpoB